jgi:endonuclease/exonuclease/phosphatase (EEP) superfamily protein YafD
MSDDNHASAPKGLGRQAAEMLLRIPFWGTAICATISLFASLGWLADITRNFAFQYVLILLCSALAARFLHRQRTLWVALLLAVFHLALIAPEMWFSDWPEPSPDAMSLRVLSANLDSDNRDMAEFSAMVQRTDPDFIVVIEITPWSLGSLSPAMTGYVHREMILREDDYGLGLFSRYPIKEAEVLYFAGRDTPTLKLRLTIDNRELVFLITHVTPPIGPTLSEQRNATLELLAKEANGLSGPVVLCGDMNVTPWSPVFEDFLRRSKLTATHQGFGYQGTWPTVFLPFLVPIDHCFVSDGFTVVRREVLEGVGSDHFPVVLDLRLEPAGGIVSSDTEPERTSGHDT